MPGGPRLFHHCLHQRLHFSASIQLSAKSKRQKTRMPPLTVTQAWAIVFAGKDVTAPSSLSMIAPRLLSIAARTLPDVSLRSSLLTFLSVILAASVAHQRFLCTFSSSPSQYSTQNRSPRHTTFLHSPILTRFQPPLPSLLSSFFSPSPFSPCCLALSLHHLHQLQRTAAYFPSLFLPMSSFLFHHLPAFFFSLVFPCWSFCQSRFSDNNFVHVCVVCVLPLLCLLRGSRF